MPYRHWYVVLTVHGVESRTGPYASRRMAERKAAEYHKKPRDGDVSLVYDPAPLGHHGRA
jgi:hypothetical protein